jgi:hypothetical protein
MLLLLLACTEQENDTPINELMVAEARIVDVSLGAGSIVGGALGLQGTLEVTTTTGAELSELVQFSGGTVGFGVAMVSNGGSGVEVPLLLPLGGPVRGKKLFGFYEGTYETAAAIGGVQTLSVMNDDGVKLETTQFATLFGFEMAWAHGELFVVHPPEDSGEEL